MQISHTFMFADLTGFTEFTERYGDERAADLALGFHRWVSELCRRHGIDLVKGIGDAVMVHATDAGAALALARHLLLAGEASGFPPIRIGMDAGPAVERAGDWFGSAVNTAARLAGLAAGGQLLMSERIRRDAEDLAGARLGEHGRRALKGLGATDVHELLCA